MAQTSIGAGLEPMSIPLICLRSWLFEQTAISLSDIDEVHLQKPVFLDVVTMHPTRLAASPHLKPLALNRSQRLEPFPPEQVLHRIFFELLPGIL
ncbi:MAG: hypothetical protein PVI45_09710 [Desulfobacterales bacterium]